MERTTDTGVGTFTGGADLRAVFPGDGELAARARALDWTATPLGHPAAWAPALRIAAALVLESPAPMFLYWGADHVQLYNDAAVPILGAKHPAALGAPARESWPETWATFGAPTFARVLAGETLTLEEQPYELRLRGPDAPLEAVFVTSSFVPVRDEGGAVRGLIVTSADVTAQVAARAAAAERERLVASVAAERERLRALVEHMPAPMALLLGPDHRYAIANAAYARTNRGGRDVIGLTVREAFPELAGQGFFDLLDRVYASGAAWDGPETLVRHDRDGTGIRETWYDARLEPVRGANGEVTGILSFAVDVTHQVLARQAVEALNTQLQEQQLELELSNQQLHDQTAELEAQAAALARSRDAVAAEREALGRVVAQIPAAVAVFEGPELRFRALSAAYQRIIGGREVLGRPIREALPELSGGEGGVDFFALLEQVYATGEAVVGSSELARWDDNADGVAEDHIVDLVYAPLHGASSDGSPAPVEGVTALVLDVTARVRAEEALRESDARFRMMADAAPVMLWVTAPDGRCTFLNRQWLDYTGQTPEEGLGYGWLGAVHPDDADLAERAFRDASAAAAPFRVDYRLRRHDGVYRWAVDSAAPRLGPGGEFLGFVGSVVDVDERTRLLEAEQRARGEAERLRAAAEAANRAKGEFLATMSHELRTPLNAIGGYAELLELGLRGPVTEQQRADLARIQQSQRHLLGLVNEVLDLARVDAGELRVERAAVRAGDTVDAALALVRPQAAARALALSEECAGAADRPYLGDEPRVRQVLVNLLANAVKFTRPGGEVTIGCAVSLPPRAAAALEPSVPYLAFRVADTGVGIPDDQLERIFEPFTQAEGGLTRPRGGTGLGLAISRRLARLMGGDLTVQSRPGAGSEFTFWLPTPDRRVQPRAAAPTAADAARAPAPAVERRTPPVLVAVAAPGLAHIGEALVADAVPLLREWVARLRTDAGLPDAGAATAGELEDHGVTLVADLGLALRGMGEPGRDPAALVRDGTAILGVIAERHGAQRARLGWSEAAIVREYTLLGEILDAAVRRLATRPDVGEAAAERAAAVVAQLLDHAARLSLGGHRVVTTGTPGT